MNVEEYTDVDVGVDLVTVLVIMSSFYKLWTSSLVCMKVQCYVEQYGDTPSSGCHSLHNIVTRCCLPLWTSSGCGHCHMLSPVQYSGTVSACTSTRQTCRTGLLQLPAGPAHLRKCVESDVS
ncbi:hypothetical protein DPMN_007434 [Dreissena polymorpha]|uniref:Uncharacterized protein n=1 Tax=Dreissena polymorpha TaxID=45954 RepID=A0A9D4MT99_DREPO|nr:hypothetical protein DPMN_007434 [Dreissena polymorpha]